jgi:hypothetical protein
MPDMGELAFEMCYSSFRKNSAEVHGVNQDNASDCLMHLDLEKWTLTLLK